MRYKDKYPTFWMYWNKQTGTYQDILTDARRVGAVSFLCAWLRIARYKLKYKGYRKQFLHDTFIGTRVM